MPDVMDSFTHLKDKSQGELLSRYQLLKASAPPGDLSDETLQELLVINRILRGRSSAPTAKTPRAPAPGLDML